MAQKVFEDKEFHGSVRFFGGVVIEDVSTPNTTVRVVEAKYFSAIDDGSFTLTQVADSFSKVGLNMNLGGQIAWSNNSLDWWQTKDTGISRASAGVVEINNGVTGTLRDLMTRAFSIEATEKIHLDGSLSGDTYIVEATANIIDMVANAVVVLQAKVAGILFPLGFQTTSQQCEPTNSTETENVILPNTRNVEVIAPENDANDWILLPSLSAVPIGHQIIIACNGASAFEMRTPSGSDEMINSINADGDALEYACIDEEIITVTKLSNADGWVATGTDNVGAITTPVIPD